MDIRSAKASEIGALTNFYRVTDYGGSVAPEDRVAYTTEEERIIGAGRLSEEEGVLVLRGMRVLLFDLWSEDLMFIGPLFQFKSAKEYKKEFRWKLFMFRMHRMQLAHIVMQ
jgi:hypothetical protein